METAELAFKMAEAGFAVFRVREDKTPYDADGLKSASLDPWFVRETFEKTPKALIGVHMGMSGVVALDIDTKFDADGNVTVDGQEQLDLNWLEIPESFEYVSLSGNGRHIWYRAPEGLNVNGSSSYRGMKGVDRRAGESYVVYTGTEVPTGIVDAPAWFLDEVTVRSAEGFKGDVKAWFDTLEQGEPNVVVRGAMERTRKKFEEAGNDFDHSAIVEATYEAVRMGAEGNPGVDKYLSELEDLFMSREGVHSRTEDEWMAEFYEALSSGITKAGSAIELRKSLPEYTPGMVPPGIPDRLFLGTPGKKEEFSALLRSLQESTEDDALVTSILWNSPKTRDISREWGLEFVNKRVVAARTKPEPVRENPTLPAPEAVVTSEKSQNDTETGSFLTPEEQGTVENTRTFLDSYLEATNTKGFTNVNYVPPVAWTCLSMAFGRSAFIPLAKTLEMNLWFITMGESTTGKGTEDGFFRSVLNLVMKDEADAYYSLGALSSPDGMHLSLLQRDGLPSIIHNDEAADFFRDIRGGKDWMTALPDKLSKWYDGYVEPSSKISLKDYKGKDARTSLNQLMWGTPDRMLELMDASQFQSGYLARVNWVWDTTKPDPDRKFNLKIQPGRKAETSQETYDVAIDLIFARAMHRERVGVDATAEAQDRLNKAANDFHAHARKFERYDFFKPAVDRLVMETTWKLASLVALYRGDTTFDLTDALIAVYYGSEWLKTLIRVASSISESPYSRDVEEMERFIRGSGGSVTEPTLLHHFRGKIVRSKRELMDRIEFLVESGRVIHTHGGQAQSTTYRING